ncbi:MAG: hypothetical protein MJ098_00165 [Saccharofermentans sp.]|nr:hypothetical protein [Saccharofermentans sp.]
MEEAQIVAMAVACIAEENGVDIDKVVVRSFKKVEKTGLEKFIADNNISYHKYQLGE